MNNDSSKCPCCSGKKYSECCQPVHKKPRLADTPEKLMRSRYTAFAINNSEYLLRTWTPEQRPQSLETKQAGLKWLRLKIINARPPATTSSYGTVSFAAMYLHNNHVFVLTEKSNFIRVDGYWLYKDGETKTEELTVAKNATCPCESGKKFKRCCGKKAKSS